MIHWVRPQKKTSHRRLWWRNLFDQPANIVCQSKANTNRPLNRHLKITIGRGDIENELNRTKLKAIWLKLVVVTRCTRMHCVSSIFVCCKFSTRLQKSASVPYGRPASVAGWALLGWVTAERGAMYVKIRSLISEEAQPILLNWAKCWLIPFFRQQGPVSPAASITIHFFKVYSVDRRQCKNIENTSANHQTDQFKTNVSVHLRIASISRCDQSMHILQWAALLRAWFGQTYIKLGPVDCRRTYAALKVHRRSAVSIVFRIRNCRPRYFENWIDFVRNWRVEESVVKGSEIAISFCLFRTPLLRKSSCTDS